MAPDLRGAAAHSGPSLDEAAHASFPAAVPADSDTRGADRSETSGYRFTTPEQLAEVAAQRKATWEWLKGVGSQILEGAQLTRISLPVRLFEGRTFLERIFDSWTYLDLLLAATEQDDPVERLKYVVAFAVSGLSCQVNPMKPFNPILGETYQARYPGSGLTMYAEQTSHHPPVSSYQLVPPGGEFEMYGAAAWSARVLGNTVKGRQEGDNVVWFRGADGARVSWQLPTVVAKNIMWGERCMLYEGPMTFVDDVNGLTAEVRIGAPATGGKGVGGWFRKQFSKSGNPDTVSGAIYRTASPPGPGSPPLCAIEGNWLLGMWFDGVQLWSPSMPHHKPTVKLDKLPSDSSYRQDAAAVRERDWAKGQTAKAELENKQRADAKLRKDRDKERSKGPKDGVSSSSISGKAKRKDSGRRRASAPAGVVHGRSSSWGGEARRGTGARLPGFASDSDLAALASEAADGHEGGGEAPLSPVREELSPAASPPASQETRWHDCQP